MHRPQNLSRRQFLKRAGLVAAQFQLHPRPRKPGGVIGRQPRPRVRERYPRPSPREQLSGRHPASRGPDHGDAPADDREHSASRRTHRSFSVVRLKSAKITPTMTNRAITFGSLHPTSSK